MYLKYSAKGVDEWMKNNLTSQEWVILAEYLDKEEIAFDNWVKENTLGKNMEILKSAQEKFLQVAKDIKSNITRNGVK